MAQRSPVGHVERVPDEAMHDPLAAGVDTPGYAPFGLGEADDGCVQQWSAECSGSEAHYDDEDEEDEEVAIEAELIDELVRQLTCARAELQRRGEELEARDSQIRYLQEALEAKDQACTRLHNKLDALSAALGSRLERVSDGALRMRSLSAGGVRATSVALGRELPSP
jgi:chromosome segregation ATPase